MKQSPLLPKKILLGLQEGSCNLKCPKCYTHGANKVSENARSKGFMDFNKFKILLDEVKAFKPRIAPQTWDEPFLNPRIFEYLTEIKKQKLQATIDTNGLLLSDEDLKTLISLEVDSVFFSVDAATKETYRLVRGVDKLDFLTEKIFKLLALRGTSQFPRVGVSFVIEENNRHESQAFIDFWKTKADVVRVNQIFMADRKLLFKKNEPRSPCWSLYDSLMIHWNGDAALCCVDTHYQNNIGNVFESGVLPIWNGYFFNKARLYHENGSFNKIPICSKCDLWAHDEPVKTMTQDFLISKTTTHTYYNRIDRLKNMVGNRFV